MVSKAAGTTMGCGVMMLTGSTVVGSTAPAARKANCHRPSSGMIVRPGYCGNSAAVVSCAAARAASARKIALVVVLCILVGAGGVTVK
jgi:hypothetical protein